MAALLEDAPRPRGEPARGARIECGEACHRGPVDGSPRAARKAAEHDPGAPAAFLLVCPVCDRQVPLCAKKADALMEWGLIGTGFAKCTTTGQRVPVGSLLFLPLDQPAG